MMTQDERKEFDDLRATVDHIVKADRYLFDRTLEIMHGKKIRGFIFTGTVDSNGSAVSLPTGWSSSRSAKGIYVITHNLNTTGYTVKPSIDVTADQANNVGIAVLFSRAANTFTVDTINLLDPAASEPRDYDYKFDFQLIMWS